LDFDGAQPVPSWGQAFQAPPTTHRTSNTSSTRSTRNELSTTYAPAMDDLLEQRVGPAVIGLQKGLSAERRSQLQQALEAELDLGT
jgi:hypothetical protein